MIEFAYNYIIEQLQHNEFAIAGFLMTSISSFVYSLYVVPRLIWSAIRRNFSYSITLEEGQDLYNEFNRFWWRTTNIDFDTLVLYLLTVLLIIPMGYPRVTIEF